MVRANWRVAASLAALVQLAACARPSEPGFTTTELVHRVNGRQERETAAFSADGVRFVRPDGTYLLRYADRTVFILDDATRSYEEIGLDQFVARQKEKEHQPDVPDLIASFGGDQGLKIETAAEPTSFADVPCRLTRIEAPKIHVEICMTDAIAVPGPRRPTHEFLQALGGPLAIPAVLFDRLQGFPVRSIVRASSDFFVEMKVARATLSIDRKPPPPDLFAPPSVYTRRTG